MELGRDHAGMAEGHDTGTLGGPGWFQQQLVAARRQFIAEPVGQAQHFLFHRGAARPQQ